MQLPFELVLLSCLPHQQRVILRLLGYSHVIAVPSASLKMCVPQKQQWHYLRFSLRVCRRVVASFIVEPILEAASRMSMAPYQAISWIHH